VANKRQLLNSLVSTESITYAKVFLAWSLQANGSVLLWEKEEEDDWLRM